MSVQPLESAARSEVRTDRREPIASEYPRFRDLAPTASHTMPCGVACHSPFYVPDGFGALVFGTARYDEAARLLAPHGVYPVLTDRERAIVCLWFTDFADSSAGPYREFTLTLLVARSPVYIPWRSWLTPLAAQLDPEVLICEYVLLLDNQAAIDYGRVLHGFDKHAAILNFVRSENAAGARVDIEIMQSGARVVSASLGLRGGASLQARAAVNLIRAQGLLRTVAALRQPVHRLRVITPRTVMQTRSDILFIAKPDVYPVDSLDRVTVHTETPVGKTLAALGFEPVFIQRLEHAAGLMPLPLAADAP